MPVWSAYCSSKHALESFSECLRYELGQFGVPVVVVKPGPVATPLWAKGRARSTTQVDPQRFAAAKAVYGPMIDGVRGAVHGLLCAINAATCNCTAAQRQPCTGSLHMLPGNRSRGSCTAVLVMLPCQR
jgi:NAD(P)-dependent dehydrogenase (short-subunit alcohol dehydrogenase family)